jgi:hypothetical protein
MIPSLISISLSVKGKGVGVLRLYKAAPPLLSGEEMILAEARAEIGAIVIENGRMSE